MAHPAVGDVAVRRAGVVRRAGFAPISDKERESADFAIALTRLKGNHYYQGTVPYAEVQRRRKRNKAARASRKANR